MNKPISHARLKVLWMGCRLSDFVVAAVWIFFATVAVARLLAELEIYHSFVRFDAVGFVGEYGELLAAVAIFLTLARVLLRWILTNEDSIRHEYDFSITGPQDD